MITTLVCDDHRMVCDSIGGALAADPEIGPILTYDGRSCVEAARKRKPDVAVLDLRVGDESGLEIMRRIRSASPSTKAIVLTAFRSDASFVRAYELGAAAYVDKMGTCTDLTRTVKDVGRGLRFIDASDVHEAQQRLDDGGFGIVGTLDETDRKILTLVARGCTNAEISDQVFLSLQTVRNRLSNLLTKFGKRNRTELAILVTPMLEQLH